MKKINCEQLANVAVGVSVVLYGIAWGIGMTSGHVSYVLLLSATFILLLTLIEAVRFSRSFTTFFFRMMLFFICWAAIFENRGNALFEGIFGFMSLLCIVAMVIRFVYFINKYSVKDAEQHLDE